LIIITTKAPLMVLTDMGVELLSIDSYL
jgi:hypothetical protein